jgi:trans-aconitate 2-methyltransferase
MPSTREWNASSYQKISGPLEAMGRDVLDRLDLAGDERVLDAGCGTGRVTAALVERLPHGRVIAVDGSQAMVDETRARLGDAVEAFATDLLYLELGEPVDAILSTATFHWIGDHETLFARLRAALKPGGRLVAQCGAAGNVQTVVDAIAAVDHPALRGWDGPWNFATTRETKDRLEAAGFHDVWTWSQEWDVTPDDPREYLGTIMLGDHVARLPEEDRDAYVTAILTQLGPQPTFPYVRLNMLARS